jgi:putative tryptophan/tyrosine transport system substrate-binding protein
MRRREFIAARGSAAAWPLTARAQQNGMPVIGVLHTLSSDSTDLLPAFRQGLGEAGFTEGKNVAIEYRFADYQFDRLPPYAADLVRHRVAVIVALGGDRSAQAAKAATSTIPIIFAAPTNPVSGQLVASLNRPGGNLTGVVGFTDEVVAKRIEQLHELVPNATSVAVFVTSQPSGEIDAMSARTAATALGLNLFMFVIREERDIAEAFSALLRSQVQMLVVGSGVPFLNWRDQLISLAARHKIPASYYRPEFVRAGGLISYAADLGELYRLAGLYTGRVLKGERPADLPVIQPTKFQLVINAATAKTLGLTVPVTLLVSADEVIE